MGTPHLIGLAASSRGDGETLPAVRRTLPDDLLRVASRRLGIIALVVGILWAVYSVIDHVVMWDHGDPTWRRFKTVDAIALGCALVSLVFCVYARKTRRSPQRVLDLGQLFLIFTAMALGLLWHWAPERNSLVLATTPMVSWIAVLVLLFAALVPGTPRTTLVIGLIAVSMNLPGMAIAHARGAWPYDSVADLLVMHFPDYLVVGVAVVISHAYTRLGQQVSKARELGSYQLGELLGKGGMGEVYRATHRMLARPAAIKLIRPEMAGGLALKRFRFEAETAAALRSPHTVELYDFGVTESQSYYFVMELLEGMTLDTLVRTYGPVPANRAISILCQVCESLEEAHACGLVHRDIKPANIHIGRVGLRHDFVKVLDFGLVKSVAPSRETSLATEVGMTPGTPDYMAPEVTMGDSPPDRRADLYALGCVGYYLLTGKLTFEARNVFHVINRHVNDAPLPPSQHEGISLPAGLDQIILSCLAKQPGERPQSAADLARLLGTIEVERWGEREAALWWARHDSSPPLPCTAKDSSRT